MLAGGVNDAVLVDHVLLADSSVDGLWLSDVQAVRALLLQVLLLNAFHQVRPRA